MLRKANLPPTQYSFIASEAGENRSQNPEKSKFESCREHYRAIGSFELLIINERIGAFSQTQPRLIPLQISISSGFWNDFSGSQD